MAVHVTPRDRDELRRLIHAAGRHADVAAVARLSPARLSQVLRLAGTAISIPSAAAIEDALGVERGALFVINDGAATLEMVGPYLVEPPMGVVPACRVPLERGRPAPAPSGGGSGGDLPVAGNAADRVRARADAAFPPVSARALGLVREGHADAAHA